MSLLSHDNNWRQESIRKWEDFYKGYLASTKNNKVTFDATEKICEIGEKSIFFTGPPESWTKKRKNERATKVVESAITKAR